VIFETAKIAGARVVGGGQEEFCGRLWPRLAASMAYLTGDAGAGEDIAQEAMTRAWARWGRVSQLDSPEAWTYRVAVNLARSRHRRKQAEQRALARVGEPTVTVAVETADAIAVRGAVAALPERMRAALVLRYFADLPVDEVAEILDCAPGTVKSLTSQAIDRLRTTITFDDDDEVTTDA
jgi:RNA polymerase sigma-70 factor (ECF subfamily)